MLRSGVYQTSQKQEIDTMKPPLLKKRSPQGPKRLQDIV